MTTLERRDVRHLSGSRPVSGAPAPPRSGHVVGSGWRGLTPWLELRDAFGAMWFLDLSPGATLDLDVLEERRCVGRMTSRGFVSCPLNSPADHFDQCAACHPLADRDCVFNPRCVDCTHELCRSPHVVYVAFYGELPKVGMTRGARGADRMVEQGADAYFVAAHVADRFEARRVEDLVSGRLDLPQMRRASEILPRLARAVPLDAIRQRYALLAPHVGDLVGSAPGPLVAITGHPGRFPLAEVPVAVGVVGHHRGTVLAAKGRYVFYRADERGPIWALNLGALVTHKARFDPAHAHTDDALPPRLEPEGPLLEEHAKDVAPPRNGHI